MPESRIRRTARIFLATSTGIAGGLILSMAVNYATTFVHAAASDEDGMILTFVKADKTAEFEDGMGKLKEAWQQSGEPERRAQADRWRLYKAKELAANGAVPYIICVDPAMKDRFPAEAQAILQRYTDPLAEGRDLVHLSIVPALGQ